MDLKASTRRPGFAPGDRGPNFVLPGPDGRLLMFYERVRGNPFVLVFLGPLKDAESRAALRQFALGQPRFAAAGFDVFAVGLGGSADLAALAAAAGADIPLFADPQGKITSGYCAPAGLPPAGPACFLFDANQRLLASGGYSAASAEWALETLGRPCPPGAPGLVTEIAPVLIVPRVIEPALCQALIQRWQDDHDEGTVDSVVEGRFVQRVHDTVKRRRDHRIMDPDFGRELAAEIGRRIAPELSKAFHFSEFRFDRFIVTCYEASRGDYFRRHRDNLSAETEDRRFALTLNLNSEEFTGGELLFPEYGAQRYRPETGAAILFSCSLLHEALPVTEGRRFTLLSFLRDVGKAAAAGGSGPAGRTAASGKKGG